MHGIFVLRKLETWAPLAHSAQLLLVQKLALELAVQLDAAYEGLQQARMENATMHLNQQSMSADSATGNGLPSFPTSCKSKSTTPASSESDASAASTVATLMSATASGITQAPDPLQSSSSRDCSSVSCKEDRRTSTGPCSARECGLNQTLKSSSNISPQDDRIEAACQTDFGEATNFVEQREPSSNCSLPETPARSQHPCMDCEAWDPYNLLLPSLLQYLSVPELLTWRLISRRTRSTKVLTQHVAEMGRLDGASSVIEFWNQLVFFAHSEVGSVSAACAGDVEQQKRFDCGCWCIALALTRTSHFAESDVRQMVCKNLQDLLICCRTPSGSVNAAAHSLVSKYGRGGLPFVHHLIAEAMLDLTEHILENCSNIRLATWIESSLCMAHLDYTLLSLSKYQRQKWVSLLIRILHVCRTSSDECLPCVAYFLKLLWLADGEPRQTYAEAGQELWAFASSGSPDMQLQLRDLCEPAGPGLAAWLRMTT